MDADAHQDQLSSRCTIQGVQVKNHIDADCIVSGTVSKSNINLRLLQMLFLILYKLIRSSIILAKKVV